MNLITEFSIGMGVSLWAYMAFFMGYTLLRCALHDHTYRLCSTDVYFLLLSAVLWVALRVSA